jgi:hypothetical protein
VRTVSPIGLSGRVPQTRRRRERPKTVGKRAARPATDDQSGPTLVQWARRPISLLGRSHRDRRSAAQRGATKSIGVSRSRADACGFLVRATVSHRAEREKRVTSRDGSGEEARNRAFDLAAWAARRKSDAYPPPTGGNLSCGIPGSVKNPFLRQSGCRVRGATLRRPLPLIGRRPHREGRDSRRDIHGRSSAKLASAAGTAVSLRQQDQARRGSRPSRQHGTGTRQETGDLLRPKFVRSAQLSAYALVEARDVQRGRIKPFRAPLGSGRAAPAGS